MATATRIPLVPTITLGSPLTDELQAALVGLEVRLSVHGAGTAELRFEDPLFTLLDGGRFDIGAEVAIELPDTQGSLGEVFSGAITAIGVEQPAGGTGVPILVIEARDYSHVLAASATFEAHTAGAADVVRAIADRHRLTAEVVGEPAVGAYVLQAGTDHELMTELARRCGYEWFTTGKELHFRPRPAPSSPPVVDRRSLLRFTARFTGVDVPSAIEVQGWSALDAAVIKGEADLSGPIGKLGSDAPLVTEQYNNAKTAFGRTLGIGGIATRDVKEAEAAAEGIAYELNAAALHAEGLVPSSPSVKAGGYVKVEGMGEKVSGSYYVTEVTHRFGPGQELQTSFVCGGYAPEPAPRSGRLGAVTDRAVAGPLVGVVTNNEDPDKLGRVKVKFPTLSDAESDWARVVSPGAGQKRGIDFRPEINDEVVVVFDRGDVRFPLVLGGVWNGKNDIPRKAEKGAAENVVKSGTVESRLITSRLGHTVELKDGRSADTSEVIVTTADGTSLTLNESTGATLDVAKGDITMKTKQGSITLTEQGDLTIDVKGAVNIQAMKAVKVDGKDTVAVKAVKGATIDGGMKFEAKGLQGKVEASAILVLKGAMVKIN